MFHAFNVSKMDYAVRVWQPWLSKTNITRDDILKIIKKLDPNKAHGHDMISIRMVKLCDASICKPFELIFRFCLESGNFLLSGKKQM